MKENNIFEGKMSKEERPGGTLTKFEKEFFSAETKTKHTMEARFWESNTTGEVKYLDSWIRDDPGIREFKAEKE